MGFRGRNRSKRRTLTLLLVITAAGCAVPTDVEEEPVDVFGAELIVTVGGRGVVSSEPIGLYCGNDGDQLHCRELFDFAQDDADPRVKLVATPHEDWVFRRWRFNEDAPGESYAPTPEGVDLESPELFVDAGSHPLDELGARALRYSVSAEFAPTPLRDDTAAD